MAHPVQPSKKPSAQIIAAFVLGYNASENSIACLRSLQAQTVPLRLVYFDNGSEPAELAKVRAALPEVEILVAPENKGFAAGWNLALSQLLQDGAGYVLAANNDLEFAPDAVEQMVAGAERHRDSGMVTPKIYYHEQRAQIWSAGLRRRAFPPAMIHRKTRGPEAGEFDQEEVVDSLTLCTVLLRAETVKRVGLLDPSFFFYCEDTDYAERMRTSGHSLLYTPDAKVWHKSPVIGSGERRPDMWRHLGRSETIFCRKHRHVYGAMRPLHMAYLQARTLAEGGAAALKAFRTGIREGRAAELLPVPAWDEVSMQTGGNGSVA